MSVNPYGNRSRVKEPEKKLVDSNVILRYLLADEPRQHEKASKFFEKVRVGSEKAVILESVLVECVYVLTKFYKVPRVETSARLRELLRYRGIANADLEELLEALSLFAEKSSLSIVDCILHVKAKRSKSVVFTFDEALSDYSRRSTHF